MLLLLSLSLLLVLTENTGTSSNLFKQCEKINRVERLDCYPDQHATHSKCESRGCCWAAKTILDDDDDGLPMCFFPKSYPTYQVYSSQKTQRGFIAQLYKSNPIYYENEIKNISFELRQETSSRLRLRFTIPSQLNRWEPSIPLGQLEEIPIKNVQYNVSMENSPFGLKGGDMFRLDKLYGDFYDQFNKRVVKMQELFLILIQGF
ncbi:unnamed protein product [Schistosoma turkestanicum]|nr:unnamed protein product [Schistosoma turkestanicum]